MAVLDERDSLCLSKLFIHCSLWKTGAYDLFRMDQRSNTFCRKECPRRKFIGETLRLTHLDTSLAQRTGLYATGLVVTILTSGVVIQDRNQDGVDETPIVLRYKKYRGSLNPLNLPSFW